MNRIGKTLLLLATFGVGINVQADAPETRYETIVDRNIFRLTSPPPPPVATNINEALEKNIELSGISNIGGKKKAWFIIKPKTGAKEAQYVNLSENERHESLEVVSISESEGEVKVLNSGSSMVLSFKNNAPKVTPGIAAPPATPVVGARPQPIAPTAYANAAPPAASGTYGRGSSVTVSGGAPPTSQMGQTVEGGVRTIPTRQLRLAPQATETVNPQKQREMMEIQKAVYDAAGVPLPPLPPSATINSGGGPPAPPAFPAPGR